IESDGAVQAKLLPVIATAPAVIDRADCKTRIVSDGSLLNELSYAIHHDAPIAWQLQLPKGSALLSCAVNGGQTNPIDRGDGLIELRLPEPGGKSQTEIQLAYTARKAAFNPLAGEVEIELPRTELLIHKLDWELRIPIAYELAALQGNVEAAGATGQ